MYYPLGGLYRIMEDMVQVAQERGIVISNADLPYTYKALIDPRHRTRYSDGRLNSMKYACSGYILYLDVDRLYPHLRHQSLYFAEDYRANLDAMFGTRTVPEEISFHLNAPAITDTCGGLSSK